MIEIQGIQTTLLFWFRSMKCRGTTTPHRIEKKRYFILSFIFLIWLGQFVLFIMADIIIKHCFINTTRTDNDSRLPLWWSKIYKKTWAPPPYSCHPRNSKIFLLVFFSRYKHLELGPSFPRLFSSKSIFWLVLLLQHVSSIHKLSRNLVFFWWWRNKK